MQRVELRNVKMSKSFSRETLCFQAAVYIDGVRSSMVENDGHGGCHSWSNHEGLNQVENIAKTMDQYKDVKFEIADQLINDLIFRHDIAAMVKRDLKNKKYFINKTGNVNCTKKLSEKQIQLLADPKWAEEQLAKMGGKRWLTDINEIVELLANIG